MPQPMTVSVSSSVNATAPAYGRSGSGRIQKKSGVSASWMPPIQAT